MKSNLILFLLFISSTFVYSQEKTNQNVYEFGISTEKYTQLGNLTNLTFTQGDTLFNVYTTDNRATKYIFNIGQRRFNEKGNYIEIGIFGAYSKYLHRTSRVLLDENNAIDVAFLEDIGTVKDFLVGAQFTYGFPILKMNKYIDFNLGLRGEVSNRNTNAEVDSPIGFPKNWWTLEAQSILVPEILCNLPNNKMLISFSLGLPVFGVEHQNTEIQNPSILLSSQNFSVSEFSLFNLTKMRGEVSFGWYL